METFASVIKQFYEIQTRQSLHEISIDEILQTLWAHTAALQRLEAKLLERSFEQRDESEFGAVTSLGKWLWPEEKKAGKSEQKKQSSSRLDGLPKENYP